MYKQVRTGLGDQEITQTGVHLYIIAYASYKLASSHMICVHCFRHKLQLCKTQRKQIIHAMQSNMLTRESI